MRGCGFFYFLLAGPIVAALKEVGVKNTDACLEWALGPGYGIENVSIIDDLWNERHSDIFLLAGSDNLRESIGRIGKAYLQRGGEDMDWNEILAEVCKREGGREELNAVQIGEAISNYNKLVEEKTSIKLLELMKRVK